MKTTEESVREVIAAHLEISPERVQPGQRLERDLDLRPLDVVLLALDLEDVSHVRLTFDELDRVETVDDLVRLVDAAF